MGVSQPPPPETMPVLAESRGAQRRRWVTPEPLTVAPALVGLPLASPWRRALAMGLDLLVLALVAESGDLWLFVGLLLVVLQLRNQRQGQGDRKRLGWLLAALLLWLAASQAWGLWRDSAREHGAVAQPAEVTLKATLPLAAPGAAPAASIDTASDSDTRSDAEDSAQQQIDRLKAELKAARAAQPKTVREQAEELSESLASRFGWGIVYFSLLPAWWAGQTLGKRVLGLRVLQLTGQPVTVMTSLKRYGGYAAGLATGGLGFAQVLWDPNRQGLQDKAAHTVVVDLRAPAFAAVPAPATAVAQPQPSASSQDPIP